MDGSLRRGLLWVFKTLWVFRYGDPSCQWKLELVDSDGDIAYDTDAFWIVSATQNK